MELSIGRMEMALEEHVWRFLASYYVVMMPMERAGLLPYGLRYC